MMYLFESILCKEGNYAQEVGEQSQDLAATKGRTRIQRPNPSSYLTKPASCLVRRGDFWVHLEPLSQLGSHSVGVPSEENRADLLRL